MNAPDLSIKRFIIMENDIEYEMDADPDYDEE